MFFDRVCIIGMGLLGGSLGMAVRKRGLAERVIGVARRPQSLSAALAHGAIDDGALDAGKALAEFQPDLVVLCVPILTILEMLDGLAGAVPAGAVVTDVGSTKGAIVAAGERLLPGRFLGGHPMAGSEQAGIEAADATLFEGACWALTPAPASAPVEPLAEWVRRLGARPLILPPAEHDRAVAATSHLPHALAAALACTVADTAAAVVETPQLAAGSFRDGTRVAASLPNLWRDICLTNRCALLEAMDAAAGRLASLRRALEAGDAAAIEQFFAAGAESKRRVEAARSGTDPLAMNDE